MAKQVSVGSYTREGGSEFVNSYSRLDPRAVQAMFAAAANMRPFSNPPPSKIVTEALKPSPTHLSAEQISKAVYAPDNKGDVVLPNGYQVAESYTDPKTGMSYAVYTSPKNKPVVAFRGTQAAEGDLRDIATDLDPRGVGFAQFQNNAEQLRQVSQKYPGAVVTGHSLGGALAQRYASNFGAGELVTFNSPGIDSGTAKQFQKGKVTHYVADGDLVSLGGEKFVKGDVKIVSFKSGKTPIIGNTADKHFATIQAGLIGMKDANVRTITADQLSDPNFKYGSNRASGNITRQSIESKRKLVGVVTSPLQGVVGLAGQALGKFGIGVN